MSETEVGRLNIKVHAKVDQIQKDMKRIEVQAKKSGEQIEKRLTQSLNAPFGKFVNIAVKSMAVMGTLEFGLRGIQGVTKAFRGDWEGAQESLDQLPLGVGAFNRTLRETLFTVTGITAETNKQNKLQDDLKAKMEAVKSIHQENLTLRKQIEQVRFETAQMQRTPEQQKAHEIHRQAMQSVEPHIKQKADILGRAVRDFDITGRGKRPRAGAAEARIGREGQLRHLNELISAQWQHANAAAAQFYQQLGPNEQKVFAKTLADLINRASNQGVPRGGLN